MNDIQCNIGKTLFTLAADAIVLIDNKLLLVKRRYPPCKGQWALPGGMVDLRETVEETAVREVREETGVDCEVEKLVGVFSRPDRDPRGRTIGICYHCRAKNMPLDRSEEAEEIKLFSLEEIPALAFDHNDMVTAFLCAASE